MFDFFNTPFMRKWLSKPLLQIALIGFACFLLYGLVSHHSSQQQIIINDHERNYQQSIRKLQGDQDAYAEKPAAMVDNITLYYKPRRYNPAQDDKLVVRPSGVSHNKHI